MMRRVAAALTATCIATSASAFEVVTIGGSTAIDRLLLAQDHVGAFELAVSRYDSLATARGFRHEDTLCSLGEVGRVCFVAGAAAIGDVVLQATIDGLSERSGDKTQLAWSLYVLGVSSRYTSKRDVARRCYDEAERLLDSGRASDPLLAANLIQANADFQRNVDAATAIATFRRAVVSYRGLTDGPNFPLANAILWLGWNLYQRGDYDEALTHLIEAEQMFVDAGFPDHSRRAVALDLFGDWEMIEGNAQAAAEHFRLATDVAERGRLRRLTGFTRALRSYQDRYAVALLEAGRHDEAWMARQRQIAVLERESRLLNRWAEIAPESYEEIVTLRDEYLAARQRTPPRISSDTDWETLRDLLVARARLFRLEVDLLLRHPIEERTPDDVASHLRSGEAVIGAVYARYGGFVYKNITTDRATRIRWAFVLRENGDPSWVRVSRATGYDEVRTVREDEAAAPWMLVRAGAWKYHLADDPGLRVAGRAMNERFLDPLMPFIGDARHLMFEGFETVPFEATTLADGTYVNDRFVVSYTPSATALADLRETPARPLDRTLVMASSATPIIDARTELRLVDTFEYGDVNQVPDTPVPVELPALPNQGKEIKAIGDSGLDVDVLIDVPDLGGRIREWSRSGRLAEFDIVHFSGHGFRASRWDRSGLIVPASLDELNVLDFDRSLYEWRMNGTLVLGSCDAGQFGHRYVGSGARNVVMSYWRVNDDVAYLFMREFYARLGAAKARGEDPALAEVLADTRRWLRDYSDDGERLYAHPVYWGAFRLFGAGD